MVIRYYQEKTPLPETAEDFDWPTLYEAFAATTLIRRDLPTTFGLACYSVDQKPLTFGYRQKQRLGGNSLSYPEAYLFTKYLADTYGLDAVLSVVLDENTFEEAFDGDFETVFQKFVQGI